MQALEMMWNAILATFSAIGRFLSRLNWNPATWDALTWLLVPGCLLLLLIVLIRPRREEASRPRGRGARSNEPELLISLGEVAAYGQDVSDGGAQIYLSMTVSNLSDFPVQLLEVAVDMDATNVPLVLELSQLLAAQQSITIKQDIPEISGQTGVISLYLYSAASGKKTFALYASLEWEPWNYRYKISPLAQHLSPVKRLASADVQVVKQLEWQAQEEVRRAEEEARQAREERERQRLERQTSSERFADKVEEAVGESRGDEPKRKRIEFPDEF